MSAVLVLMLNTVFVGYRNKIITLILKILVWTNNVYK